MIDITLDLLDISLDEIGCNYNEISKIKINLSNIKNYYYKLKKHRILIFDRNCFENNLLKKAKDEGATVLLGKCMRNFNSPNEIIIDNDESIKGEIIIDASGISCQVGRRIGINTKIKPRNP